MNKNLIPCPIDPSKQIYHNRLKNVRSICSKNAENKGITNGYTPDINQQLLENAKEVSLNSNLNNNKQLSNGLKKQYSHCQTLDENCDGYDNNNNDIHIIGEMNGDTNDASSKISENYCNDHKDNIKNINGNNKMSENNDDVRVSESNTFNEFENVRDFDISPCPSSKNYNDDGPVSTHVPSNSSPSQIQQKDTTLTKIFVGGLPYHTTDESLRIFFEVFGDIEEAVVITDRQTGKSRGYGFVTMSDKTAADRAVKDANPIIDGRKANVNLAYIGAKPRTNGYGPILVNGIIDSNNSTHLNGINIPLGAIYTGLLPNANGGLSHIMYNPLTTQVLNANSYLNSPNVYTNLAPSINPHQQTLVNSLLNQGNGLLSSNSSTNITPQHYILPLEYGLASLGGVNAINLISNGNPIPINSDNFMGIHHLNSLESDQIYGHNGLLQSNLANSSLYLSPGANYYNAQSPNNLIALTTNTRGLNEIGNGNYPSARNANVVNNSSHLNGRGDTINSSSINSSLSSQAGNMSPYGLNVNRGAMQGYSNCSSPTSSTFHNGVPIIRSGSYFINE
ncbi:unnamed protein product [Gordionus sp. m RMFG-2023]|uniref:homeobox protein 2-like n=1 Tax=Gordionus sp. m RMFG-2023 TaxID=3053472 RepID=UPI0030E1DC74